MILVNKTLLILAIGFFTTFWANFSEPKLFVVGDSISMQYGPYLEQYLEGVYAYDRKREEPSNSESTEKPKYANGGDSDRVLAYLQNKLKAPDFRPDVLLINCGLHDIKTDAQSGKKQVGLEAYKQNLEQIYDLVAKKGIKMVWVRTTPVDDTMHNSKQQTFYRYAADVAKYNEVADEIFKSRNVPIIDLHQFTLNLGDNLFKDHVHFGEETRAKQGAFIAGFLSNLSLVDN
ncbi:SGNH/GDSL hydrolase family protein [Cyclobacterium marinum]|uniref:SGNH/GDSL hydrolase family protein n=1 Tax=Cyclobacterium marinum TaxID=104 RepID=UPI0011EE19FA|nr:SGNH/GDSL hydrolase family protein [Cyclobacterium marinum]MBI0397239.1 SGNH/GDSL hydrolase family protein [Cyclobacterium marinum]